MLNARRQESDSEQSAARQTAAQQGIASPPAISLPKGGGAIRGIGEKFAANPVTGTGSMSVPIATSPGRSGFGPQLSLSYDSGAGNGPFGFGWNLSLPAITRKTDKGLPKYQDTEESDVFILSGAEDLVPVLIEDGGQWQRHEDYRTVDGVDYRIHRYRPRIEGLFARIERWTNQATGEIHWRSITRDNITTLYGKSNNSRIFDPGDPTRIFSWLICESYDDKGNVIVYGYQAEDDRNVDQGQANERNRLRTANRYLKRIKYGNRTPNRDPTTWQATDPTQLPERDWMFEVVFDYGEHDPDDPKPNDAGEWLCRHDPFSSYRAGFEVRTYRLCQRVLMFHHFPAETGVGRDCLVRSTDLVYRSIRDNAEDLKKGHPVASFIASVTQSGYKRQAGGYLKKSLPPLEFEYSQAIIHDEVRDVDAESLENLPYGLDGTQYRFVDLDGEGLSGVLTEQGGAWFYKRNLSPAPNPGKNGQNEIKARFGPLQRVAAKPSLAALGSGGQQFLDLAGDGQLDLAMFAGPTPGFCERTQDGSWEVFRTFTSLPNLDWNDPNMRFVDLTGDGHADILITEDAVFNWHLSLAEAGFGPREQVRQALDEEQGPRLVFADGTQSIYLADFSGDNLVDLVRIRNGQVCYWPNLGYGRFGAKVTMDNSPWFDTPDQFDQGRIRLADIDGSGTTDIIYLGHNRIDIYRNQAGNSWSARDSLANFPRVDNLSSVMAVDLLGNGTACLVWSSTLPGDAQRPMRYIDLMGGQKPHLLIRSVNNLGAETRIQYAPSTKFYLADKLAGKPWITRIPFPVHVVERVETYDHISRNRFAAHYAYHHGYFDGMEREFRGFGMVEQWDTEEYATLSASGDFPTGDNIDAASHVPPVLTKTWFHTGAYIEGSRISRQFETEYYREGDPSLGEAGLSDKQQQALLLEDTVLPISVFLPDGRRLSWNLSAEEQRQACRALKGSILRQEVYAQDVTEQADRPYAVSERNYTIELLQPAGQNRYAVFLAHPRETADYQYERKLIDVNGQRRADPRLGHTMTLSVDPYGNVLRAVTIGYQRRDFPNVREAEQKETHITLTVNRFANCPDKQDWYRVGLPVETRTYEIVKPPEPKIIDSLVEPFRFETVRKLLEGHQEGQSIVEGLFPSDQIEPSAAKLWPYEKWDWRSNAANATAETRLRTIEHVRSFYREDDLSGALPLGQVQSMALPFESYKLAFTPGLAEQIFVDSGKLTQTELNSVLTDDGKYVHSEGDANWWIPSGRTFYSPGTADDAATEQAYARQHFFLPHRFRDPFGNQTVVAYDRDPNGDEYNLLVTQTRDALDNVVRAENDYRVLQPALLTDPNGNRSEAAFDALGMVVATAVMGKADENLGDLLEDFDADPPLSNLQAFIANPQAQAPSLLGKATTRIVYDVARYQRAGQPPFAATLARETHFHDQGGDQTKIQVSFSFSDGFGREVQKKIQAEAGDAPQRQAPVPLPTGDIRPGDLVRDAQGNLAQADTLHRWVGTGRTVYNNKGKPVRQYEPFFSATHLYEPERDMTDTGVSPILFYDPVERVVATLHPNHTYEKVVFDPWQQKTYDVNDTVILDPQSDEDVKAFFLNPDGTHRLPESEYLPTWYDLRTDPAEALKAWPDTDANGQPLPDNAKRRAAEKEAAEKTEVHADTPTVAHFDSLGRTFLTEAHNKFARRKPDNTVEIIEEPLYRTLIIFDIEGNQRAVIDARGRVVMRYDYSIAGPEQDENGELINTNRIHQASMEAGQRWMLNDVAGQPIRAWDSRGHNFKTEYDQLRRPVRQFVRGTDANHSDPRTLNQDIRFEQIEYGEDQANDTALNLRTRVFKQYDAAGVITSEEYDFKGNLLRSRRELAQEYKDIIDWTAAQPPGETFSSSTTYDALNRPVTLTSPDNSIVRPAYNEANLLERVEANLRGAAAATPFVTNINYNARGQRTLIRYGNGSETHYQYDSDTFRLIHLYTRRGAAFTEDCDNPQPPPPTIAAPEKPPEAKSCGLQNLRYTYDPAGNITHIRDDAQQTIYFKNKRVEPSNDYTYDAVYRLIKATGREHLGQNGEGRLLPPRPTSHNDAPRVGLDWSANDGNAMGRYREQYEYDEVGNFTKMIHRGTDPAHPGWTRAYTYEEDSQLEGGKKSNRLTSATIGTSPPEPYSTNGDGYDPHGNMLHLPQLQIMEWDFKDQLNMTQRQAVNNEDEEGIRRQGERTYYVYDAGGQRVRKVTERAVNAQQAANGGQPTRMKERIYLGGFEIYREYNGDGSRVTLERETLHIMDDQQRIALVETKTTAGSLLARARSLVSAPKALIRYQFDNHLGSASLELDGNGQVISYEEYTPYGSTSYQAVRSQIETPKRYRYTGKERDEESGLYYHGARHYVPWLGRWCSCDPSELREGTNLYQYVLGQPTIKIDADGYSASNAQIAQILKENQAAAMVQGKLIPEFPSINEYPELKASAQKAAIETIESAGIKGGIIDPDKLYETFRRRLFTQWRRMIRAKGANPIKSLFSIGKGNQLQFRKGPFKGQRVNLHHSVTRAQIRELNLPPELAIDPDNLTPQGESFHQKRAHPDITETTKVREGTVPERKQALKKLRSSVSSKGAKVISTLKGIAPNIAGVIIDLSAAKAADILQSNEPLTEENIEFMRNWGYTYEGFNEQSQTTPEFRYEPSLLQRMGNKIYLFFRILTDAPFTKSLLEAGEQYGDPNLS